MTRIGAITLLLVTLLASVSTANAATTWVQLSPTTSPPARYWPAMAYDAVTRKVVLFGGIGATGTMNDTWLFDGTNWSQVPTPTSPFPRYGAGLAFDRVNQKLILFGGIQRDHVYLSDTWVWDGATLTWTQLTPVHSPPPLVGTMAFTDPSGGHVSFFGGQDSHGADYDTTFRWTGTDWTRLSLSPRPEPRAFGSLTLDHGTQIVMLFGGESRSDTNNTWTWNGQSWTKQAPPVQPPFTFFSASAYDRALKSIVLFGGMMNGNNHNLTWSWDGSTWQELLPTVSPSARSKCAMAYDSALGHLILFGGTSGVSQFLNDTWEFQP